MKRRDLLKTSVAAAGLIGVVAEGDPQKPSEQTGAPPADNRPAEYLHRVQGDPFLPKPPAPATVSDLADAAGRTGQTEDCAAAGLLQHRARRTGQRELSPPAMAR